MLVEPIHSEYIHNCSGLKVRSSFPIAAPILSDEDAKADFDLLVSMGEPVQQPFRRPSEVVIAELVVEGTVWYTFCKVDDGYIARLFGIADFWISSSLNKVVCHMAPAGNPDYIPIIVPGTIIAFILSMRGECVLHASAVEVDGSAVIFIGASGQGKSTMAAMLCADGGLLITDDVLPVEFEAESGSTECIFARPSGREIRLREKSASLGYRIDGHVRTTADLREAVTPKPSDKPKVPFGLVVIPLPDRAIVSPEARRLSSGEAAMALARFHRIEGWRDSSALKNQFSHVSEIARITPVFEVRVPWGPPFADDVGSRVLEACRRQIG